MCTPSLHGLSISSCPTRVPALAAVDNGLLYGTVSEINLFLPEWLWSWCFIVEIVTLTKWLLLTKEGSYQPYEKTGICERNTLLWVQVENKNKFRMILNLSSATSPLQRAITVQSVQSECLNLNFSTCWLCSCGHDAQCLCALVWPVIKWRYQHLTHIRVWNVYVNNCRKFFRVLLVKVQ